MVDTNLKAEHVDLHARKRKRDSSIVKYIWLACHATIVVLSLKMLVSSLLLRKRLTHNRVIYRLCFTLVASNYTFSVLQYLDGEQVRTAALLAMASVQYLCLAVLWIVMPTHSTKLVPFAIISLLHCLDTVSPVTARKLSNPLSLGIGWANLLVFFKVLSDALLVRHGGAISLICYAVFYRFRFQFSPVDRHCALTVWRALDTHLGGPKSPAKVKGYWEQVKARVENYESQADKEDKRLTREHEAEAIQKKNAGAWTEQ